MEKKLTKKRKKELFNEMNDVTNVIDGIKNGIYKLEDGELKINDFSSK